MEEQFDYIIVGAGSAGCALAGRLSENGRHRVLLLEAGGDDRKFWIQVPIGYGKSFYDPSVNWMYMTEPVPTAGNRQSYWPRGKVIGGSSSINAMVYIRGQAEDFNDWREAGNPGWGWDDILPVYRRMESHAWGESPWHGSSGPLHVSAPKDELHPLCEAYIKAGEEAGLPRNDDFNGASQEGVGTYHVTTRDGLRMSAARAYLWPARRRANLRVEKHAMAERLLFDGTRATGVEYRCRGALKRAHANAEVIVSAGAVGSPLLLMRSGIGPAADLKAAGIDARVDRPGVGRNMQDHYIVDQTLKSRLPTLNNTLTPWWGKLWAGLQYVTARRGPMSLSLNQGGGFFKTRPDLDRPNMQLYFSPLSYLKGPPGKRALMHPDPFAGFILSISPCRPTSRGYLRLRSTDPEAAPEIHPNYLATEHDLQDNLEGLKFLRQLTSTPTMKDIVLEELFPGPHVDSDEAMLDYIRTRGGSVFHPSSTCMMGPDPQTCVVDAGLNVYGVETLRVADASIFPTVTSGNINAPSIMVGEKASDIILQAGKTL
ncbi:GMC family oxidoreductase N-terminal domain-containing protein [Nisaea sp.]|uniref:GMC family oxidoreductase n=1 Tax=Nisaea sp. TaxID=2024842 RepID=UPI0032EDFF15